MVKQSRKNKLERSEVALVRALLATGTHNEEDIVAYYTCPSRPINHARISEIRTSARHAKSNPARDENLQRFLDDWALIDWSTWVHLYGDHLLIKVRRTRLFPPRKRKGAGRARPTPGDEMVGAAGLEPATPTMST